MEDDSAIIGDFNYSIEARLFASLPVDEEQRGLMAEAVRTAASQLNLMTPTMLRKGTDPRLMIKTGTAIQRGALIIIYAKGPHCVTTHLAIVPNGVRRAFDQLTQQAIKYAPAPIEAGIIDGLVTAYGAPPGEPPGMEMPPDANLMVALGGLLLLVPERNRDALAAKIEYFRNAGIAPALIGLCGPGGPSWPGKVRLAWPIALPVGPYLDVEVEYG
jgi:hypothetical protein